MYTHTILLYIMCGIYGFFNLIKFSSGVLSAGTLSELKALFEKGKNRGPDVSTFVDYTKSLNAVLGFHRLSINGLDAMSNQPMVIGKKILLCNGEIYNHKQLCKQYGFQMKTNSDCEIILHLYEKVGFENMIQMLDGVFAFMLIDYTDLQHKKVYVARDPHGVRPLYIAQSTRDHSFGFTSVMKQIDTNAYRCSQFKPGSWSKYTFGNSLYYTGGCWQLESTRQYYTPLAISSSTTNYSFLTSLQRNLTSGHITDDVQLYMDYYQRIVYDQLCNAVQKRVDNTDRPIACLLSGGLDSSLITALVCRYYQTDTRKLETYSIGMEGSEDLAYAKKVALFLGTKHTEIIESEEVFLDAINEVIYQIESYDTTTVRASVGNYLVSKYISENSEAKVIFNGDGSDEVTGGYLYFHSAPNEYEFDIECKRLLSDICYFDVLRSDRSISSNGLEARTPFLDKAFVSAYLSIPASLRCHNVLGNCEKFLLRSAFANKNILPEEVLWRTKEAFSDGVSKQTRSWYEIIQDYVMRTKGSSDVVNDDIEMMSYTHNTPTTLEQLYYRKIFTSHFGENAGCIPYFWMPKFINATDASARTLSIYNAHQQKLETPPKDADTITETITDTITDTNTFIAENNSTDIETQPNNVWIDECTIGKRKRPVMELPNNVIGKQILV